MRRSWRLLLFRNCPRLRTTVESSHLHFQVQSSVNWLYPFHTLSRHTNFENPKNPLNSQFLVGYNFSSEPLLEPPENETESCFRISDIFSKFSDTNDISKELELNNVVIDHEKVLKVLKSLDSRADVAKRFFYWVLERDSERLSSKSYNLMLAVLGVNGYIEEFWDLVETMKKKGYGISRGTRDKVTEKFKKEELKSDLEKLKGVFASGSVDNSLEKIGLKVSRIVRNQVWGEDVERQIEDLNVVFSSELVKIVLENLAMEPTKALIFFRWLEGNGLFKHDERSYNAMARTLGREDCIDRFWKVIDEMRSNGYEMEMETYVMVLGRFLTRRMIKEAVDLYEFVMNGANKPPLQSCVFLLKKIVTGKEFDVNLLSRVVKIFIGNDNELTESMLDALLKSVTSIGRFGECTKILKEIKEGGFVVSANCQSKIVSELSSAGTNDEVREFVNHIEASGNDLDYKVWESTIQGHCASGQLKKASSCFRKMIGKGGVYNAGHAFECLVNAYCRNERAIDASKLMHQCISRYQLKPWHTTYKALISNLLVQDEFVAALKLLGLMKNHGFPPFLDPFIEHVSKHGLSDDAIVFLKAMTSKKVPSTSVVLRLFEAFFKAGKLNEAQDILSKCPGYIRKHADVLNLFCSVKSGKDTAAAASVAV